MDAPPLLAPDNRMVSPGGNMRTLLLRKNAPYASLFFRSKWVTLPEKEGPEKLVAQGPTPFF